MTLSAVRLGDTKSVADSDGLTTLYTVPAGSRAILRDARLTNAGSASVREVLMLLTPAVGDPVSLFYDSARENGNTIALQDAFIVLNEGDAVAVVTTAGVLHCTLSGHEFTL